MLQANGENQDRRSEDSVGTLRVGVYVCHCGGNISDVVDIDKILSKVSLLENVAVARKNLFMCSDPGQNMIEEDIRDGKINRVVVAACSPSLHEITFRKTLQRAGLNPYLFEHVNIREQVSWVSSSDHEGAVEKAIRLVAAGVAKTKYLKPLEPVRSDARQHVVVVGGGITGLHCARDLSRRGFEVSIIERSPFLGGQVFRLRRTYPVEQDGQGMVRRLLDDVSADKHISVYTMAEIRDCSGFSGSFSLTVHIAPRGVTENHNVKEILSAAAKFPETVENEFDYGISKRTAIYRPAEECVPKLPVVDWELLERCKDCLEILKRDEVVLDNEEKEVKIDAGAIVMATGFSPYEPSEDEFGYGTYPEVLTLPQLKRLIAEDGPTGGKLEINGRAVKSVGFIHCVGSRQIEGVHTPKPDGSLNTYCSRYCCTATLQAANEILDNCPDCNIYDFYQDIRTYGRGHEDYYENASQRGVLFFRYKAEEPPTVYKSGENGRAGLMVKVKDLLTFGEEVEVPVDLLVLATGMEPSKIHGLVDKLKLPRSADGFLQEVHPKLKPVELAVEGVFIAGCCQGPMDIAESCTSASAAAAKVSVLLGKGYIESDPFVAEVDSGKCCGTGNCVEACKFVNAVSLVEQNVNGKTEKLAKVNAALCKGCGMCVPECPNGAIQLEGWRIDQYDAMVDAIMTDY